MARASTCIFRHHERDIDLVVHGDDFVSVGSKEDLQWARTILENKFEISTTMVGPEEGDERKATILNRIIQATNTGFTYEADARHSE